MRLRPLKKFKVPVEKIVKKTLPQKERKTLWVNVKNNIVKEELPMKKIPLNVDSFVVFPEFRKGEDR